MDRAGRGEMFQLRQRSEEVYLEYVKVTSHEMPLSVVGDYLGSARREGECCEMVGAVLEEALSAEEVVDGGVFEYVANGHVHSLLPEVVQSGRYEKQRGGASAWQHQEVNNVPTPQFFEDASQHCESDQVTSFLCY